jgi:predicted nucleotidyltransferase
MLKNIKSKIKKFNEIDDILLFGSAVRGKEKPSDVDVMIIFKEKVDKQIELKVRSYFKEKISIVSKTLRTVLDDSFDARESVLFEGKSFLTGKTLGEKYGYSSLGMFKYDFKDWSNVEKTKFYYALNGRGKGTGMFQKFNCIKLSDRIFLVPLSNIEPFREFLDSWDIEYKYIPLLIPTRLNKKRLLQ